MASEQMEVTPKRSSLALVSLCLSILGLTGLSVVAGIPALICGHLAIKQISRSYGALIGYKAALAGTVMGYLSIGLLPLWFGLALPYVAQSRNWKVIQLACINNLLQIEGASRAWAKENHKLTTTLVTFDDLRPYLKNIPSCPCTWDFSGESYVLRTVGEGPVCVAPRGGKEHGHELSVEKIVHH